MDHWKHAKRPVGARMRQFEATGNYPLLGEPPVNLILDR